MIKLTFENITSYIRIVAYFISGLLVQTGIGGSGALSKEAIAGYIVAFITFLWTLWGQRLVAKINELAKLDVIQVIEVAPTAEGKALKAAVATEASPTVHVAK